MITTREIKLRAFCPFNQTMWYEHERDGRYQCSFYIIKNTLKAELTIDTNTPDEEFDFHKFNTYGCIVMQWTGLKDKNGIHIYEGDIITFSTRRYHLGQDKGLQTIKFKSAVVWEEGSFMVSETQENDTFICAHNGCTNNPEGYEVIGNIYENSELLKKQSI